MTTTRLLVVHARSPLHAGTGQATAAVDLPIARDRATGFPLLPGSSIKGSLRARARESASQLKGDWLKVFGPETAEASDHGGAVSISDARLLLLPVRSVAGTFAWVTSPYLLSCFIREASLVGIELNFKALTDLKTTEAYVTTQSKLRVTLNKTQKVVLEEFDLPAFPKANDVAERLAVLLFKEDDWQRMFLERLCIVDDDTMAFLAKHGTDIVTRVAINPETGTAHSGQLWTEENLPAESVLVSVVEEHSVQTTQPSKPGGWLNSIADKLLKRPIQLGGKATVGRGRCDLHLISADGRA